MFGRRLERLDSRVERINEKTYNNDEDIEILGDGIPDYKLGEYLDSLSVEDRKKYHLNEPIDDEIIGDGLSDEELFGPIEGN